MTEPVKSPRARTARRAKIEEQAALACVEPDHLERIVDAFSDRETVPWDVPATPTPIAELRATKAALSATGEAPAKPKRVRKRAVTPAELEQFQAGSLPEPQPEPEPEAPLERTLTWLQKIQVGYARIRHIDQIRKAVLARKTVHHCQVCQRGRLVEDPDVTFPSGHTLTRQLRRQAERDAAKHERGTYSMLQVGREPRRCDRCGVVQVVKLTKE